MKLVNSSVTLALGLAFSSIAMAQNDMSGANVNLTKDSIEAEYKKDKANCESLSGNPKDICMAEAKGKEKVAKAEFEARQRNTPKNRYDVETARAEAAVAGSRDGRARHPQERVPEDRGRLGARRLRDGLASINGVRVLGAVSGASLPVAAFVVDGVAPALVAARLSAEHAIGVRHGCFCAHPYLLRLLGLDPGEVAEFRAAVLRGDRRNIPGAVRASAGLSTTKPDIERFVDAVARIAAGEPTPVPYDLDPQTGDYWPHSSDAAWSSPGRNLGASCARG